MTDKPKTRRAQTAELVFGYNAPAGDIKDFLSEVPDHADVTVTRYEGDAREPTETTITARWKL